MLVTIDRKAKDASEALRVALDRSPAARQLCKSISGLEKSNPKRVIHLAAQDRTAVFSPEEEAVMVRYLREAGVHSATICKGTEIDDRTDRIVKQNLFKEKKRK